MNVIQELQEALENNTERAIQNVRTSIPGIITKYYPEEQVADIQIAITRRKRSGSDVVQEEIPILPKVPVRQPRSKESFIHLPLKANDKVIVFFHDRDVDNYRKSGKVSEANTIRKHSLSDAFCIPGCFEDSEKLTFDAGDADKIVIQNGDAKLSLSAAGEIRIGKKGEEASNPIVLGNEIKEKLDRILDILISGDHILITSPGNPSVPNPIRATELLQIKTELVQILSNKHFTTE